MVIKLASIARELLKAEGVIEIFDSLYGAMGTGFMVINAAGNKNGTVGIICIAVTRPDRETIDLFA